MAQANRNTRRVSEMNGRGRGRGRGHGRGRAQGRGRGRGCGGRRHPEARWVTGTDGKSYEVHPSYKFNDNVWQALSYNEKQTILDQRKQYVEDRKRSVSEISLITGRIIIIIRTTKRFLNKYQNPPTLAKSLRDKVQSWKDEINKHSSDPKVAGTTECYEIFVRTSHHHFGLYPL